MAVFFFLEKQRCRALPYHPQRTAHQGERFWPISAAAYRQLWVELSRSCPQIVLVKSDANDWSGRMQMGGQVRAITQ